MAGITRFSQQDPKWKSKLLGFDNECTLGGYGCLLTSMTMVAGAYGFNETPDSVNEKMKAVNGFQGAMVMPYQIGAALPGMVIRNYLECQNQPAPLAEIDASLSQGKQVIIEVDYSPKDGLQNHWIVLTAKQGSDYLIADPWPSPVDAKDVTLTSRYGFAGSPAKIIQAVMWLEGPAGAVKPPPPPKLDTGVVASFKVYATADDLAIRSQTLVSDATLVKRVPMNTEFSVLEADATAKPKVGQMNQWLAVKAADGTTGYVAAWFVGLAKAAAPATPPPAPAQPKITTPSVVVKTTTEGVALRDKPDTTDITLIKRLPLGSELKVFEVESEAKRKIGVQYEWLQVKDITGQAGFVAAWYVALVGPAALGARNVTPAAPPKFDVGAYEVPPVLLRGNQDGLALRSEPLITANTLIKRLPLGVELIAIEPPDIAAPKIGRMGDWINVRDVTGEEGYVAAWYVIERPADPAPAVGPADS